VYQQLEKRGISAQIDDDEQVSPGAKFYRWELKGVPVRIEIGPRDVQNNQVVLVNRAQREKDKKKQAVALEAAGESTENLLTQIHELLFSQAQKRQQQQWHTGGALEEFGKDLEAKNGFYQTGWCQSTACEELLKKHRGTIRCIQETVEQARCFGCDNKSVTDVVIAKAY